MTNGDIARRRMHNQLLAAPSGLAPGEVVRRLGAVQAQEYLSAKWALALRCGPHTSDSEVQQAIDEGSILRTHVLRPTWHFVAPEDAAWMLALTGPRVLRGLASRYRQLELDEAQFERSQAVFRAVLAGGKDATRLELKAALEAAGIDTSRQDRFGHMLTQAELSGLLVSGPYRGKQNTYTLLEARAPRPRKLAGEDALAELALRYFSSHGPATLKDYTWWSGLTMAQVRAGIETAGERLVREEIDGQEYYGPPDTGLDTAPPSPSALLLPDFDEYVVAYADRSAVFDPDQSSWLHMAGGVLSKVLLIDGMVAGGWKRKIKKNAVRVTIHPLAPLSAVEESALAAAVERYAAFLGLTPEVEITL